MKKLIYLIIILISIICTGCSEQTTNKFTVRFFDDDILLNSIEVNEGDYIPQQIPNLKEGYDFIGWFIDEDYTIEYNENQEVTSDIILYAKYEKIFKVGLICLHDESSTYDKNFIDSMNRAIEELGLKTTQLELVTGIGEDIACYYKANELAKTCDIVFADSFGHQDFMKQAAKENKNVWFCHLTGTKAHTTELDNYYNAFASIYEGRYLNGIAAGMKLNQMIENGDITAEEAVIGFVGSYPYSDCISAYTSFFLGARSVCPTATMKVRFTFSVYDFDKEKTAAEALINVDKCVLISQHADSYGAPTACEQKGVPNVSYNGSTSDKFPETYLISCKIDWTPYFVKMIKAKMNGEEVKESDYTGTLQTGSVIVFEVGKNAAPGTQEKIDEIKAQLQEGSLHVFDVSKFTVNGTQLNSYLADVDDFGDYLGDTEVIKDGYFHESEYRSAPYFDLQIDGIYFVY